jgi:hypothetical protein
MPIKVGDKVRYIGPDLVAYHTGKIYLLQFVLFQTVVLLF